MKIPRRFHQVYENPKKIPPDLWKSKEDSTISMKIQRRFHQIYEKSKEGTTRYALKNVSLRDRCFASRGVDRNDTDCEWNAEWFLTIRGLSDITHCSSSTVSSSRSITRPRWCFVSCRNRLKTIDTKTHSFCNFFIIYRKEHRIKIRLKIMKFIETDFCLSNHNISIGVCMYI